MKRKLLIVLFLTITTCLYAQTTITHSGWQSAYAQIGNSWTNYSVPFGGQQIEVYIGTASNQAQYWDFSTYAYSEAGTSTAVDPATAPGTESFPDANVTYAETLTGGNGSPSYVYHKITEQEYASLGHILDEDLLIYNPPIVSMVFPATLGTTWETTSDYEMYGMTTSYKGRKIIDAYGTIKLPTGEYEALRIVSHDSTTTTYAGSTTTNYNITVAWYTNSSVVVSGLFLTPEQLEQENVSANTIIYSVPQGASANEETNALPTDVLLNQNYPNPFNPTTSISYSLPAKSHVTLSVFNSIGQEVSTLVSEEQQVGCYNIHFDASDLSSGIYFYSLRTNNQVLTKKMTLVK